MGEDNAHGEALDALQHWRGDRGGIGDCLGDDVEDLFRAQCDIARVGFGMFGALPTRVSIAVTCGRRHTDLGDVAECDNAPDGALQRREGV